MTSTQISSRCIHFEWRNFIYSLWVQLCGLSNFWHIKPALKLIQHKHRKFCRNLNAFSLKKQHWFSWLIEVWCATPMVIRYAMKTRFAPHFLRKVERLVKGKIPYQNVRIDISFEYYSCSMNCRFTGIRNQRVEVFLSPSSLLPSFFKVSSSIKINTNE